MAIRAKFEHTNLIVENLSKVAEFYDHVFGCKPLADEREVSGRWLDELTGVSDAQIRAGDLVTIDIPGRGTFIGVYATDPERNIIELQHWSHE